LVIEGGQLVIFLGTFDVNALENTSQVIFGDDNFFQAKIVKLRIT
jgi:hypothetical protein